MFAFVGSAFRRRVEMCIFILGLSVRIGDSNLCGYSGNCDKGTMKSKRMRKSGNPEFPVHFKHVATGDDDINPHTSQGLKTFGIRSGKPAFYVRNYIDKVILSCFSENGEWRKLRVLVSGVWSGAWRLVFCPLFSRVSDSLVLSGVME
jgi:hypothetical protein